LTRPPPQELAAIETKLADPALWSDPNATKRLCGRRSGWKHGGRRRGAGPPVERHRGLLRLAREGEDVLADLERDIKALAAFNEELEARTMLNGEADPLNAIVTCTPARAAPRARTGPRC